MILQNPKDCLNVPNAAERLNEIGQKICMSKFRADGVLISYEEWNMNAALMSAAAIMLNKMLTENESYRNDRDAWQRRAEAAERDMMELMKDSNNGCDYCKNHVCCTCSWDDCKPEWRGPRAENGGVE